MKKVPVSSVFNDSEGLYRTTVCRWLVRRPHHSARLMRFGSRGPREFATEMPWLRLRGIKAVQGLGMAMSTVASEKNRKLLFISNVFYKQWYICVHVLFHSVRSQTFAMEQITCSSPREQRKWRLGLSHNLQALGVTCVRSHSTREIKNAFRKWV